MPIPKNEFFIAFLAHMPKLCKKIGAAPTNALVHPISHFWAISGRNNAKRELHGPQNGEIGPKKPPTAHF